MARCDANKDGVVTFEEVNENFGQAWSQAKKDSEEARFKEMDKNGDGKIEPKEFEEWIMK
mgnify:CR=1 FL=1